MKTLKQIEALNKAFQDKFGTNIVSAEQGSIAWLQSRLGVITASEVKSAIAKADSDTRSTYMCGLVAEVATSVVEEINSKHMDWGKLHEQSARSAYEFANDCEISQVGFIFKDDSFREGASLDGLIVGKNKHTEIKCPWDSTNFIKFSLLDKIKKEYEAQAQFQMRVIGSEVMDFVQYDPRMHVSPLKVLTIERDEKMQAKFDELIPAFIEDMDKMLAQLGISFGDQWKRLALKSDEVA